MSTIASADKRPIKSLREQAFAKLDLKPYPRITTPPMDHQLVTTEHIHKQWEGRFDRGEKLEDVLVTVQGRIKSVREASKKLFFYDIEQNGRSIQVVASLQRCSRVIGDPVEFAKRNRVLLAGDIVRGSGFTGKTNTGEMSVFATHPIELLSPCLHTIPSKSGLVDPQKRFRNRYLDLLVNSHAKNNLRVRAQVLQYIRQFLDERQFMEVETPILSPSVGGAAARPFVTQSSTASFGDTPLFLRVAPELYLKQLVIGGLERVYEMGKQFRNEGMDADHNPEFTTCEFYQAYGNLDDLVRTTEELLYGMCRHINGSSSVYVYNDKQRLLVDMTPPFRQINVTEELRRCIPELPQKLNALQVLPELIEIARARNISAPKPHTIPRLLDRLIGHFIEPQCTQPTFLTHHPAIMSPLAKSASDGATAARFELFIAGKEFVNAYEELNDPNEQRSRFAAQVTDREAGDDEVPPMDRDFCDALEFGLPPTAGWGMGVDRVIALLSGSQHLRETIAFPIMRPDNDHSP